MMATRIDGAIKKIGARSHFINDENYFGSDDKPLAPMQVAEPTSGTDARFIDWITTQQPNLIIFDLSTAQIPWRNWIAILKSSPATRRIPIVCFGPHVAIDLMSTAESVGADVIVPRSRFVSQMVDLLSQQVLEWDYLAIDEACRQPLHKLAYDGLRAFNAGDYFLAHELLEDAWNEDTSEARDMYKAVLQVAVAYLQIERHNYRGAVKMFLRARQWLSPLPDYCRGINIKRLKLDAATVYAELTRAGPEGIAGFDRQFFKPVEFDYPTSA